MAKSHLTGNRGNAKPPLLELKGVNKDYGTKVITHALIDVELAILAGEFTALIGPSGSGKSSLLNIIGLLDRPTRGSVYINGQNTKTLDEDELTRLRAETIGFVFQFHHLLPGFTALENVLIPLYSSRGWLKDKMEARALSLLEQVGLGDKAGNRVTDISGGQQQRVAIARSLIMKPQLILADEPTGNLDTKTAADIFSLMREINSEQGTTFIIVTHQPELADRCDRTIEIVDGRLSSDSAATV